MIRKVMEYALHRQLLLALPNFPTIKQKDEPRGWFPDVQYRALIAGANELVGMAINVQKTEAGDSRTLRLTADLPKMIQFMVNSIIRPTDLKNMQHKHVESIRSDQTYLRLSLPKSKDKDAPIVTVEEAVAVYEQLKTHYAAEDLAGSDDYVFMPQYPNRDTALRAGASAPIQLSAGRPGFQDRATGRSAHDLQPTTHEHYVSVA